MVWRLCATLDPPLWSDVRIPPFWYTLGGYGDLFPAHKPTLKHRAPSISGASVFGWCGEVEKSTYQRYNFLKHYHTHRHRVVPFFHPFALFIPPIYIAPLLPQLVFFKSSINLNSITHRHQRCTRE